MARIDLLAALAIFAIGCEAGEPVLEPAVVQTVSRVHFERWCAEDFGLLPGGSTLAVPAPWPSPERPEPEAKVDVEIQVLVSAVAVNGRVSETWFDELARIPPGSTWALIPSADVSVARVEQVAAVIAERVGQKGLLYFGNPSFPQPTSPHPDRSAAALAKLMATPIDQRSHELAGMLEVAAGGCVPFGFAMRKPAKLPPEQRCAAVAAEVPAALASCPAIDQAETMALLYLLMVDDRATRAELPIELATAASEDPLVLEYGHGQTWGELATTWFESPPIQPIGFRRR